MNKFYFFIFLALISVSLTHRIHLHHRRNYDKLPQLKGIKLTQNQKAKMNAMDGLLKKILLPKHRFSQIATNQDDGEEEAEEVVEPPEPIFHEGWMIVIDNQVYREDHPPIQGKDGQFRSLRYIGDSEDDGEHIELPVDSTKLLIKNSQWNPEDKSLIMTPNTFYVRMHNHQLFYTETPDDLVVLEAMEFKSARHHHELPGCVTFWNNHLENWHLCIPHNEESPKTDEELEQEIIPWIEAYSKVLGYPLGEEGEEQEDEDFIACLDGEEELMTRKKNQILIHTLPSLDCELDWDYEESGQNWQCNCSEGDQQSPIDLPLVTKHTPQLKLEPKFQYEELNCQDVKYTVDKKTITFHTENYPTVNFGTLKDVDGTLYMAKQIVVKTPAEHTIDGEQFDMEVQIVHEAIDGNFKLKAVLSFLYKQDFQSKSPFLDNFNYEAFSNSGSQCNIFDQTMSIWKFAFPIEEITNSPPFSFYKYLGSFTTPPCEENVVWFVAADPIPIGLSTYAEVAEVTCSVPLEGNDFEFLKELHEIGNGNHRVIQDINDREVMYFDINNSCNPPLPTPAPPKGHFEKVEKQETHYFFVNSDKPSGVPGAFVVSEAEKEGKDPSKVKRTTDRFNLHSL